MRRPAICLSVALAVSCGGGAASVSREVHFPGTAAVRVSPGRSGEWLLLFEKLQIELDVTAPIRTAGLLRPGSDNVESYQGPDGWTLIDAVAHPSGDVSLASVRTEPAPGYPLRGMISRIRPDGARIDFELYRIVAEPEPAPAFLSALDRIRIVPHGEELFAVMRWANNAVQAYRLSFAQGQWKQSWVSWVEPAAEVFPVGIIGGGFDNFHQENSALLVYADVDARGNLWTCVESSEDVVPRHDAFFGENLGALTNPAGFDFGTAVLTGISAEGARMPARLVGFPGRPRRVLNLRVDGESVVLSGRIRTGDEPGGWDGWILSLRAATGAVDYERNLDVQGGDMLWDVVPLGDGKRLAIGSTNYTQNPHGLSVSDSRDALAVILDAEGRIEERVPLPGGPAGRGNEAIAVTADGHGQLAIAGVQNAPGTHAEVYSDAFVVVRSRERLTR